MTGQILPFPPIPSPIAGARPRPAEGRTGGRRQPTTRRAATRPSPVARVVAPLRPRRPVDAPNAGDLPPCA